MPKKPKDEEPISPMRAAIRAQLDKVGRSKIVITTTPNPQDISDVRDYFFRYDFRVKLGTRASNNVQYIHFLTHQEDLVRSLARHFPRRRIFEYGEEIPLSKVRKKRKESVDKIVDRAVKKRKAEARKKKKRERIWAIQSR